MYPVYVFSSQILSTSSTIQIYTLSVSPAKNKEASKK